jgi:hypothetical protein
MIFGRGSAPTECSASFTLEIRRQGFLGESRSSFPGAHVTDTRAQGNAFFADDAFAIEGQPHDRPSHEPANQ